MLDGLGSRNKCGIRGFGTDNICHLFLSPFMANLVESRVFRQQIATVGRKNIAVPTLGTELGFPELLKCITRRQHAMN